VPLLQCGAWHVRPVVVGEELGGDVAVADADLSHDDITLFLVVLVLRQGLDRLVGLVGEEDSLGLARLVELVGSNE
jgi:hypothetical protein